MHCICAKHDKCISFYNYLPFFRCIFRFDGFCTSLQRYIILYPGILEPIYKFFRSIIFLQITKNTYSISFTLIYICCGQYSVQFFWICYMYFWRFVEPNLKNSGMVIISAFPSLPVCLLGWCAVSGFHPIRFGLMLITIWYQDSVFYITPLFFGFPLHFLFVGRGGDSWIVILHRLLHYFFLL